MPVLQPLLEFGCLSQMQTNKANSTNWLDVWAELLYGFNGRWWWTRSKGTIYTAQDFLPAAAAAANPLPSIMKAYQSRIRLETSLCGVPSAIASLSVMCRWKGKKINTEYIVFKMWRHCIIRSMCVLFSNTYLEKKKHTKSLDKSRSPLSTSHLSLFGEVQS